MITHLSAKNVPVKRTTLSSWGRSSVSSPFYDEEETWAQSTKNSEQPGLADQGSGAFMTVLSVRHLGPRILHATPEPHRSKGFGAESWRLQPLAGPFAECSSPL